MQKERTPGLSLCESSHEFGDAFLLNTPLHFSLDQQPYILSPTDSPRIWEMARQSFAQLFGEGMRVTVLTPAQWYAADPERRALLIEVARRRHQVLTVDMGWDIRTSEHKDYGGVGLSETDLHQHDDVSAYSMTLLGKSERTGEPLSTTRLVKPLINKELATMISQIFPDVLQGSDRSQLLEVWQVCTQFLIKTQLLGFREPGGLNATQLDIQALPLSELRERVGQIFHTVQLMIAGRVLSVERQVPLYTLPEGSPQRRLHQLFALLALTPVQATMMLAVANTGVDHFLIQTTSPFLQLLQQGYGEAIQPLWQTVQRRQQPGNDEGLVDDVCHTVLIDVAKAWQLLSVPVHTYYLGALNRLQSDQAIVTQKIQYIQDCRRVQ